MSPLPPLRSNDRWIDVTRPIGPGLPIYPGDPPPVLAFERAQGTEITHLTLTTHTGTHLDLPRHVLPRGATPSDEEILDSLNGPTRVLHLAGEIGRPILAEDLRRALRGRVPERLLLRTDPPRRATRWRGLDPSAARWLAGRARMVGTDALSVDPPDGGLDAHRILLGAGTLIVENLQLEGVQDSRYTIWSLPIRLQTADGAPLRVLLAKREARPHGGT